MFIRCHTGSNGEIEAVDVFALRDKDWLSIYLITLMIIDKYKHMWYNDRVRFEVIFTFQNIKMSA